MSICVTENQDSQRIRDAMDRLSDLQAQAEITAAEDFKTACQKGDANALPNFAPMVTDWTAVKPPVIAGQILPRRTPTLSEVMAESLDYGDGPSMTEAMQLLLNAASGANVQAQAQGLIDRMAATWAKFNTEVQS